MGDIADHLIDYYSGLLDERCYMQEEPEPEIEFNEELLEKCGGGDCFIVNGRLFMDRAMFGGEPDLLLVHGEVTGKGRLEGVKYAHCWLEKGNICIDVSNGNNIEMPKSAYYAFGRIGDNVYKYNVAEFRRKVCDTEHWGPWDLKSSTGL